MNVASISNFVDINNADLNSLAMSFSTNTIWENKTDDYVKLTIMIQIKFCWNCLPPVQKKTKIMFQ